MATYEKDGKVILEDLLAIYSTAEIEMLSKVAKRVEKGITTSGWNEQYLSEVQGLKDEIGAILEKVNKEGINVMSNEVAKAYTGNDELNVGLNDLISNVEIPMNLKQGLYATHNMLEGASFQILRNADDAYRKTMASASVSVLSGQDTIKGAVQRMLNEYAQKGITTFVDKAGRNWNLSSYAEMCARTVTSQAALQGHIERMNDLGEDLMEVSSKGTSCPLCAKWQGVVLSISGKTKGYRTLDEAKAAGLFHPNCEHTLMLYNEELDGPGQTELNVDDQQESQEAQEKYGLLEKQRANERNIRYWKKREALAITPEEQEFANRKVKQWRFKNLIHCEKFGLTRMFARECNPKGFAKGKQGVLSAVFKEMEEAYEYVVGTNAQNTYKGHFNINLGLTGSGAMNLYKKWLKSEITSLDDLSVDIASLKDKDNKKVTLTSMYQKYIGDTPAQDYAEITEFEKGTKEYKSGYAKWLKTQVEEIGKTYQVKPQNKEITVYVSKEDQGLSATELYKKYHGKKPTDVFKEEFGYMDKAEYGKWLTSEKNKLMTQGIKKVVPYENAKTTKTSTVVTTAKDKIDKAKEVAAKVKAEPEVEPPKKVEEPKVKVDPSKPEEVNKIHADALKEDYHELTSYDKENLNEELDIFEEDKVAKVTGLFSASQLVKTTYIEYMDTLKNGNAFEKILGYKMWVKAKANDIAVTKLKIKEMGTNTNWEEEMLSKIEELKKAYTSDKLNDDAKAHAYEKLKLWEKGYEENKASNALNDAIKLDITQEMLDETPIFTDNELSSISFNLKYDDKHDITAKIAKEMSKMPKYNTDGLIASQKSEEYANKMFVAAKAYGEGKSKPVNMLVMDGVLKKVQYAEYMDVTNTINKVLNGDFGKDMIDYNIKKLMDEVANTKNPYALPHKKQMLGLWEKAKVKNDKEVAVKKLAKISAAELSKMADMSTEAKIDIMQGLYKNRAGNTETTKELKQSFLKMAKKYDASITETNAKSNTHFDTKYIKGSKNAAINSMSPLQALHDYTSGSMPFNLCKKKNESANYYFQNKSRYTRTQAEAVAKKIDEAFNQVEPFEDFKVLRHGNDSQEAIYSLLGGGFDDWTLEKFYEKLNTLNSSDGSQIFVEKGFFSTSPHMDKGFKDKLVEVRILARPGTKGIYVEDMSYYKGLNEDEVILPRNQKFRFIKGFAKAADESKYPTLKKQDFIDENEILAQSGSSARGVIIYLEALP